MSTPFPPHLRQRRSLDPGATGGQGGKGGGGREGGGVRAVGSGQSYDQIGVCGGVLLWSQPTGGDCSPNANENGNSGRRAEPQGGAYWDAREDGKAGSGCSSEQPEGWERM